MATQTTYYNFNKPAGTDLVNPLTDTIPNWDLADAALHGLSIASIGTATEVVTLGVHALTRVDNPDAKFFQFIATGDFDAGETFTVDGVAITAAAPDGSALATDCYVTGSVVLCSLNADDTLLTLYVPASTSGGTAADSERLGGELPAYYSSKSYADDIKTTADAAASAIAKKALVNVYYDSSTGKLYRVLSDGSQGSEISIGSKALNFNAAVNVSSTTNFNNSITANSDGVFIAKMVEAANNRATITVNNKTIVGSAGNQIGQWCTGIIPVRSGDIIAGVSTNGGSITFIPYA